MTKKNFLFLILAVVGILLFGLGLCMCLLPEWNAFTPGLTIAALGAPMLLAVAMVAWIMAGKPVAQISWKAVGKAAYFMVSLLVWVSAWPWRWPLRD